MADWSKIGYRGNVEDRRGLAPAIGGLSLTGVALILIVNYLTGGNLGDALQQIQAIPQENRQVVDNKQFEGEDSYEVFASTVLGSNNVHWARTLQKEGKEYTPPKLVLFRQATQSACGTATSQIGPHYCPLDQTIYLDETFFDELTSRFGARGGDVAQAYVISHEVGHHVQQELGIMQQVQQNGSNDASIRLELQADCYAGMWANSIKDQNIMEAGEIEEAMDAASSVGDDRIQEKVNGYIDPENWTHGSSEQRRSWFNKGYSSGTLNTCNTFQ